jgi:hypothetical protein
MSKLSINIASVNVYIGTNGAGSNSDSAFDAVLDQLMASALSETGNCEATEATEAEQSTSASVRTDAQVLRAARVMVAERGRNSSTGWVLNNTRKQGNAVLVAEVVADEYVVVQASSTEGEALQRSGVIETTGYVNKYYTSGNFGSTVHSTMAKAEEYSDGDCVAVEVYVAKARSLQMA